MRRFIGLGLKHWVFRFMLYFCPNKSMIVRVMWVIWIYLFFFFAHFSFRYFNHCSWCWNNRCSCPTAEIIQNPEFPFVLYPDDPGCYLGWSVKTSKIDSQKAPLDGAVFIVWGAKTLEIYWVVICIDGDIQPWKNGSLQAIIGRWWLTTDFVSLAVPQFPFLVPGMLAATLM